MKMDHGIYAPTAADYGIYRTRRYPKGRNVGGPIPTETSPTDPNSNPSVVQLHYSIAGVAPHASTERWRYQVPPKRKARLQSGLVQILRDTAAAPESGASARISLIRAQVPGIVTSIVHALHRSNVIGSREAMNHTGELEMFEGDIILFNSFDVSTGGTLSITGSAILIEYDALPKQKVVGVFADITTRTDEGQFGSQGGTYPSIWYGATSFDTKREV